MRPRFLHRHSYNEKLKEVLLHYFSLISMPFDVDPSREMAGMYALRFREGSLSIWKNLIKCI